MERQPLKGITVSKSVKLQLERLGGPRYESIDIFSSESEEVSTSLDEQEVEEVRRTLRARIDKDIENETNKIKEHYASLSRGGY